MTERWHMYSKIQIMKGQGFTQRKAAKNLGIHRITVNKYWNMSTDEFEKKILEPAKKSNLEQHKELILSWLRAYRDITAAQIHDWLKEKYKVEMAENSVRRYVRILRIDYDIKPDGAPRQYEALKDPSMGLQLQVDIGSISVENIRTRRYHKLYCIGFVLSHSRYKYGVWFGAPPDAQDMVNAIRRCFDWLGGKPKELVFDQDRLIAVNENYGDIIYTKEFEAFRQSEKLDVYLCRKGDPETKGRIEAVVKYFKYNFARYRQYSEHWVWEEEFDQWLDRTGNAKKHSVTKKIPAEVFEIERGYLTPVSYEIIKYDNNMLQRKIRKDNTVMYEGNRYSVPTGTFGIHNEGQLEITGEELLIYDCLGDILLAKHRICLEKGQLIQNRDHLRKKDIKIASMQEALKLKFPDPEEAEALLTGIHTKKRRYSRDQFLLIEKTLEEYGVQAIGVALHYCVVNELYSAVDFKDAVIHFSQGKKKATLSPEPIKTERTSNNSIPDVKVAKRNLQDMIKHLQGGANTWLN